MMRPKTIIGFEALIFATLLLGVIQSYLSMDEIVASAPAEFTSVKSFIISVQIISVLTIAALVLLVSRKKSKIAMWILTIFTVIGTPWFLYSLGKGQIYGSAWISSLQTIGQCLAICLLFSSASRAWMSKKTG